MEPRAMKTRSVAGQGPPKSRTAARMTRLHLLRKGAEPSFLPAMKAQRPNRTVSDRGATMTEQYIQEERLPCLKRRSISCFDLIVPFTKGHLAKGENGASRPYAHKRLRPLARRALRTARPPREDMRARKPWHLARLRLFGWYVRFISNPPRRTLRQRTDKLGNSNAAPHRGQG